MTIEGAPQPDQQPHLWDRHVSLYEEVFEPVTLGLVKMAIEALSLKPGASVIDSGAGAGGAALELARRGARVIAIDASAGMAARIMERAADEGPQLRVAPVYWSCLCQPASLPVDAFVRAWEGLTQ